MKKFLLTVLFLFSLHGMSFSSFLLPNIAQKLILAYGNTKIDSVQLSPDGSIAYFVSKNTNNRDAIFMCYLATKKVMLITPLDDGGGFQYTCYSPKLCADGTYIVYLRSKGGFGTANFKRELVVINLKTKIEAVVDYTTADNPNKEFELSKRPWAPKSYAFTYTVTNCSVSPNSYVATAQKRTDTYWPWKVLNTENQFIFKSSIWSPKGGKIAYIANRNIAAPNQPPNLKQYVNIVNASTGVWSLSLDVTMNVPNYIRDLEWDWSENYIYCSFYAANGYPQGGFNLGRINVAVFMPFVEDDYGQNVFAESAIGQEADGHITGYFMSEVSGDLYVTREITNGAASLLDLKKTTQVIRIPFIDQNTYVPVTTIVINNSVYESVDFNQTSPLVVNGNSGILVFVQKRLGEVVAINSNSQPYFYVDLTLEKFAFFAMGTFA